MSNTFTPIITSAGLSAALAAEAGGFQVNITHIATGESGYTVPVNGNGLATATGLVNERDRVAIQHAQEVAVGQTDLSFVIGGTTEYFIREVGFFLADGTLFAIASHPTVALMWKSAQTQAAIAFELVLEAVNPAAVTVISAGPPLELLLTPERARLDALEAGRALVSTTITGSGLVTGGGTLGANRVLTVADATQVEAETGTSTTKAMSPLRVHQAITAKIAALIVGTIQPFSTILSSFAAINSNGIIARTAAGAVAARSVVAGAGITVTNGDAVAGNPTVSVIDATQADAEAGTGLNKTMSPLRVAEAIRAQSGMGGPAKEVASFASLTTTNAFYAPVAAPGSPDATKDFRGLNITSSAGESSTFAFGSGRAIYYRDNDSGGTAGPWRTVLLNDAGSVKSYTSTNAPDAWIIGANFQGDTAVSLLGFTAYSVRLGNLVMLTLRFDVEGFSLSPWTSDDPVTFSLDINALAQAAGWGWTAASSNFGLATGVFSAATLDTPIMPFQCSLNSNSLLYFANLDMKNIGTQTAPMTSIEFRASVTFLVE